MTEFDRSPAAQNSIQLDLDPPPPSQRFDWRRALIAPGVFLLLTLIVFGAVLFARDAALVVAAPGTDLSLQFIAWREFGFTQLARGNLPLWNPHIYGGTPYFAGFQSALLYPPNWLHLLMPLGRAINWITALHVFLAGYFTYLWCRYRAVSIGGSIIAGIMFMFCGPYFLHVYAGHLPHVAIIVWIPLILLAIDGVIETGSPKWWLLGTVALTMQILAGHPQYVYYTGIVASIYFALRLVQSEHRVKAVGIFIAMYVAAVLLSAVQLLPGFDLTRETVRSGGLKYEIGSTFSLPPENFLTMLVPNLFGAIPLGASNDPTHNYFGRCYLWEVSAFLGITGLVLAIVGALGAKPSHRRFALAMLVVCFVLALGRHTPLYWLMYKYLPQYASFRGTTKFAVFAAAFASMLAAMGFDRLIKSERPPTWPAVIAGALALLLAMAWFVLGTQSSQGTEGWWGRSVQWIGEAAQRDNEMFIFPPERYHDADFVAQSARRAAVGTAWAALTAAAVALVLFASTRQPRIACGLVALAAIEMVIFARHATATMTIEQTMPAEWQSALAAAPAEARVVVVNQEDQNAGMIFGFDNIWGYDPGVLKRYAELMYAANGMHPDQAMQYPPYRGLPNAQVLPMLRCALALQKQAPKVIRVPTPPLPEALLVRNYAVSTNRDTILRTIIATSFEPRLGVILEADPNPAPVKGGSIGTVSVGARSTDSIDIAAEVETPALLLITNNFARGWRATSLDSKPAQASYAIMPANWAQQAVALGAGKHHLRIEYRPASFVIGKWITIITLTALAGGIIVWALRSRRRLA